MLRLAAQQLDGVGVAAGQQGEQLVEGVHCGIRLCVHYLLKVTHTQQVGLTVQSTAPDVNIRALHVGAIGVAAAVGQKDDIFPQTRMMLQELIFRPIKQIQNSRLQSAKVLLSIAY